MGIAYEGALYRGVATDEEQTYEYDRYIFVGFNMLHKVERMLFDRLKKQGKAFFYWDFDKYFMPVKPHTMRQDITYHNILNISRTSWIATIQEYTTI